MKRINILHLLVVLAAGVEIYNLYCGAEFSAIAMALLVAAPIAAVLSFIVSVHDGRAKEGVKVAMDGMLLGTLLSLVLSVIVPAVLTVNFGWLLASAIFGGFTAGFLCPKRYSNGLRI
ncbi:MAG: hypothetical protein K2W95_35485 [Candidatus Obscuribacterales bacterium]|nr:hypothetical protein [Candidatus Obscuribacterales bacterium]